MLVNATVSWCSVKVNREVLQRLLRQVEDVEKEIATVDRMLRLGASTEMVSKFYGLTHQEVALRRDVLGLPKRKGRHPVLSEEQDTGPVGTLEARRRATRHRAGRRHGDARPHPRSCRRTRPAGLRHLGDDPRAGSTRDWCRPWGSTSLIGRGSPVSLSALLDEAAQRMPPRQAGPTASRWIPVQRQSP
jgi:hypothetical protein